MRQFSHPYYSGAIQQVWLPPTTLVGWLHLLCRYCSCWLSVVLCFSFLFVPSWFPLSFQLRFPLCLFVFTFSFFSVVAANCLVCWRACFCPLPACSLWLALSGRITLLYLQCVFSSRSLLPQSSSLYEASARTLVVLDADG